MSSHLVPEQRADKNGRLVTRHVKNGPATPTASKSIPAPTPGAAVKPKKQKAKKPLAKQLETMHITAERRSYNPDKEVVKALGIPDDAKRLLFFKNSQAGMFDLMSVVSPDNAAVLMEWDINSSEQALEFLHEHGLDHLAVDRKEMMDEAVSRRLDPYNLMEMHSEHGMDNYDPDVFLGAVRLRDAISLPQIGMGKDATTFHDSVLKGEISYDDVMEIGITSLKDMQYSVLVRTHESLKDIHSGAASYDASLLKHLNSKTAHNHSAFNNAVKMVDEHGADYVRDIRHVGLAIEINEFLSQKDAGYRREVIDYADACMPSLFELTAIDFTRLHEAGIPVDTAVSTIREETDIDRVIGAHQEGISSSVSSGWL